MNTKKVIKYLEATVEAEKLLLQHFKQDKGMTDDQAKSYLKAINAVLNFIVPLVGITNASELFGDAKLFMDNVKESMDRIDKESKGEA